jgi:hypothetical protein
MTASTKLGNYGRPLELEIVLLLRAGQKLKQQSLLGGWAHDQAEVVVEPVSSVDRSRTSCQP